MTANVDKFHFRLVLLGSNRTGKTSILNRFLFKKFESSYKPTVEDLFSKSFDLGSVEINVDFLDTSGSMQFPAMRRLSLTQANAFLLVYALDDEKSYEVIKICVDEIMETRPDFQEIPMVFVGNKNDIPKDKQRVRKEVVSNYVHYELPRLRAKVIECSCKESINIDTIFRAYLSLAKVAVSTGIHHTGSLKNPPRTLSGHILTAHPASDYYHQPQQQLQQHNTTDECSLDSSRRSSSSTTTMGKVVLGVRKSCDASILSPMKGALQGIVSSHSNNNNSSHKNNINANSNANSNNSHNNNSNSINSTAQQQQQQQQMRANSKGDIRGSTNSVNKSHSSQTSLAATEDHQQQQQQHTEIVNLQTAIQTKLSIRHSAKPRSRSLIWRPHNRKSRTQTTQESECKVS